MADEETLSKSKPPAHKEDVVFPPTNHEGLNLHHHFVLQEPHNEIAKPVAVNYWWFSLFKFKLPALFPSLNFPLIGSTVLLLLLYLKSRLRRRRRDTIDGLLGVIKQKDERINHLLQQIARMNELLLASHHGVPITSRAVSG